MAGIVDDPDLLAALPVGPAQLLAQMAEAGSDQELATVCAGLRPAVIELHDEGTSTHTIARVIAATHDVATRRLLQLAGELSYPFTWLALGGFARREGFPSSDQDNALAYEGPADAEPAMLSHAEWIVSGLAECGFRPCDNGALASRPLFCRSLDRWRTLAQSLLHDPDQEHAVILVAVLIDGRPLWNAELAGPPLATELGEVSHQPRLLHRLGRLALDHRPPTGFFRDFVVSHEGEHRGTLDIKQGGMLPITTLARWAAIRAGVTAGSTLERLSAAAAVGTLDADQATMLRVAFELFGDLRMAHQVEQLRAGRPPDDHLDPRRLDRLTRRTLREAFRAVADIQRGIERTA